MNALVCVLVDAFRHDYLDAQETPVLSGLAQQGSCGRIHPILGYSDSIRATIFTGLYPDEHGYWMEYCYRPDASPFRGYGRAAPLDRIPSDFVQRGIKFVLSRSLLRMLARRRGYRELSLRHIPFRAVEAFDWTLRGSMTAPNALGCPTLFDDLSAIGCRWEYVDFSAGRRRALAQLDGLDPATRLVFVYLHQLDMASHLVGIRSPLFRRTVRRTDSLVGDVLRRVEARIGRTESVVFSDHGMSAVDRVISYAQLLRDPDYPHRFCVALDATMVRLWWVDANATLRERVRRQVADAAPGRFLGADELRELHLDFDHRLYGDEIFLLEPSVAIFPNFHSLLRPRAMHAYHPDDLDQHGIVIAPADERLGETVELTELAPLVLRRLGVSAAAQSRRGRPRAPDGGEAAAASASGRS